MAITQITESEYLEACDMYLGWCKSCKEFTRDSTEPDAHGYDCPVCEKLAVVGAEDALMMGLFTFSEE